MKKVGSRMLGLVATVMSILMLAPLMLMSSPAPAHAAGKVPPVKMTDDGTYYLDTGIHVSGKTFFGFERKKKDGRVYLCLENLAPPPKNLEYTGKDYTHRELAYLLWKYGEGLIGYGPSSSTVGSKKVKDPVKNANAKQLDAAAIAYIGKYDSKYNSKKKFPNGYYPKRVRDRAAKLRTEAKNYMGPYTVQGSLKVKNEKQMELSGVGIKSKAGRWMSGTDLKLQITGDATFAENGKKTITKKTTTKGMNLAVNRGKGTAKSDISVKVDGISGLPSDKIRIYNTERAKKPAKTAGQFAVGVRPGDVKRQKPSKTLKASFPPEVTTKAQDQVTELDENGKGKIADNVSVRGGHPGDTVEIAVYQNGPTLDLPPEGEQSLDVLRADNEKREKEGMPTRKLPEKNNDSTVLPTQVHSVKLDENGNADFRTDDFEINESGYYWFTYDLHSTDMTEPKSETEVIHDETTFVKWRPFVETVAQDQKLSFDESGTAEIADILRVWGLRPNSTVDIEVTANGPDVKGEVKNNEQTPKNAPKVGSKVVSVTADAKGEALVRTEPFEVKKAGYYWFTYKHEGDEKTTTVEDKTKYARETSFVYFQPKVRTVAEKQEVKLRNGKAQIRDTMHVSEGRPGDTVTIKVCVAGGDTKKPTPTGNQKKPGILYTSQGVVKHSDTPEIPDTKKKDDKKSEKRTDLGAPREMPKSNNCKDVKVKLNDKGEATVKTEPFEVNKVGYYYFTYSSKGNGNTDRFEDGNIYEEETVFVSENPVAGGIADAPEVVKEAAKAVPGMSSKTGGAGLPIALLIAGILLAAGGTASVVKSKKS